MSNAYTEADRIAQVYVLVSLWIEVLIYGIYTTLFIAALYVMNKRRSLIRTTPSKVFLATIILMYSITTFHIIVNVYRLVRAYGIIVTPDGPIFYFRDFTMWDNYAHTIVVCVMTWLGDALVIYRCFIIWGGNFYIITVPILLLVFTIGMNTMVLYWFGNNFVPFPVMRPWLDAIYPVIFAQNVVTTGLIAFKIWSQHRDSRKSGLIDNSRLSLINVMRIIVESAVVYTFQLLLLIILYFTNHPAQYIVQSAIVPSIGIVFVLIAIRVHVARTGSVSDISTSMIPPWLEDEPVFNHHESRGRVSIISGETHRLEIITPHSKEPALLNRSSETTLNNNRSKD